MRGESIIMMGISYQALTPGSRQEVVQSNVLLFPWQFDNITDLVCNTMQC